MNYSSQETTVHVCLFNKSYNSNISSFHKPLQVHHIKQITIKLRKGKAQWRIQDLTLGGRGLCLPGVGVENH